jgi:hypothetical protein
MKKIGKFMIFLSLSLLTVWVLLTTSLLVLWDDQLVQLAVIINKLHMSCIAGHQQGKQVAYGKRADGSAICAIIAGSYYLHDEDYMDDLSNMHWRGLGDVKRGRGWVV